MRIDLAAILCVLGFAQPVSGAISNPYLRAKGAAIAQVPSVPYRSVSIDWALIHQSCQAKRHGISSAGDGTHQPGNPGQFGSTCFDDRSSTVKPDATRWEWGLGAATDGHAGQTIEITGGNGAVADDSFGDSSEISVNTPEDSGETNPLGPNSTYTLSTGGVVNGAIAGAGSYPSGTIATLSATPNPGYIFTRWTGGASGSTNPLQMIMDADKTVGADFNPDLSDTDGDGLSNYEEVVVFGTDPTQKAQAPNPRVPVGNLVVTPVAPSADAKANLVWSVTLPENANAGEYTHYIRQYQAVNAYWTDQVSVPATGQQLSAFNIGAMGSRFELWTVSSNGPKAYLLSSNYVGPGVPVASVAIRSEDPYSVLPRTRADRPFFVDLTLSGLSSGDVPEVSKSVNFCRHVQSYGLLGNGIGIDRTQATLLDQTSISTNGTQTLTYAVTAIPGTDRSKVRGEERFSVYSQVNQSDAFGVPPMLIDSQTIQIWPVAKGLISGITEGQVVGPSPPSVTLNLNNLYPSSSTYVQVYKGSPAPGVNGTIVPGSGITVNDSVPINRTRTISNYGSVFDSDGIWTMEILTKTPFGIDRIAHVSFTVKIFDLRNTLSTGTSSNGMIAGAGPYEPGSMALVTATPNPGYVFAGWTEDASGSANPLSILMDSNKTIGATFVPDLGDTDGDGISNYAETVVHGTDPTKRDTDGDGWSDGAEHEFNGDPVSVASTPKFELRIATESTSDHVLLSFPGEPGASYVIQASENLCDWPTLDSGMQGTGDVIKRFVPKAGHPTRFFRVNINR